MTLPMYRQIADHIADKIRKNEAGYHAGDALPGARTLAETNGVAVGTAQQALAELIRIGLASRPDRKGKPMQVADPLPTQLTDSGAYLARARREGRLYAQYGNYARIEASLSSADPETASALGINEGDEAITRRRVRYNANDIAQSISVSYYRSDYQEVAPELLENDRLVQGSWALLEERTGLRSVHWTDTGYSRPAQADERETLNLDDGVWVRVTTSVITTEDGTVVEYGRSISDARDPFTYSGIVE